MTNTPTNTPPPASPGQAAPGGFSKGELIASNLHACQIISGRDVERVALQIDAALTAEQALRVKVEAELELQRMQAAAVMTATVQNTEKSIKDRISRGHPYWTQAYADVCAAVDREIQLRTAHEATKREYRRIIDGLLKGDLDARSEAIGLMHGGEI